MYEVRKTFDNFISVRTITNITGNSKGDSRVEITLNDYSSVKSVYMSKAEANALMLKIYDTGEYNINDFKGGQINEYRK